MSAISDYRAFLEAKMRIAPRLGFDVEPGEIAAILKPHQRAIVAWMVQGGRRACFAQFGLGKTLMQIEAVRLTRARAAAASGRDEMALIVVPLGVRQEFVRDARMLSKDNAGPRPRSLKSPLPTITAGGSQMALVEPFVLSRHGEGAPRSIDEPTPTQVAKHSHVLISPYYGSGSGETCSNADDPLPTITSKGRFGMVVPITHADGSNRARDVDSDPLPTITTAHRGEFAFIAAQFGERDGQEPRVHDLAEPSPTICATGRINVVEGEIGDDRQYDILFRMLEPHELAAAMGFDTEEASYEFAGTKTQKIKQIGNAVSVAKMKACVGAIMADEVPAMRRPSGQSLLAAE